MAEESDSDAVDTPTSPNPQIEISNSSSPLCNVPKPSQKKKVQTVLQFGSKKGFIRPLAQRKKRSLIWKFVKVDPDDSSLHVCLLCNDHIVANNNTTNSRRHLEDFHRAAWTEAVKNEANNDNDTLSLDSETSSGDGESTTKKRKQKSSKELCLESQKVYARMNAKKIKIDESVTRMIAEDFEPYAIVERKGFVRLLHLLDPKYVPPNRTVISRVLMPQLHSKIEALLTERLKHAKNLAITFDGWRSSALVDYLLVTGHYLPFNSSQIESVALCLINCTDADHSAEEYAKKIRQNVIERFRLDENGVSIVCATTDNAANMVATARELRVKHMGCYSHKVQLVVNDLLFPKKKPGNDANDHVEENIYQYML